MTEAARPQVPDPGPMGPDACVSLRGWSPDRSAGLVVDPEAARRDLESGVLLDRVVTTVRRAHGPATDTALIHQAFDLAARCHTHQVRRSGEPYLVHPIRVAETVARMGMDLPAVAAALLHDTVEDSDLTVFELGERIGKDVAGLVDGVTKLGKVPYLSRKAQQAESFRKMLLAMSRDLRVLVIKLADRLDNMRTLEHMPPEKRERISRETMDIYAPLAHRLGLEEVRLELEDLAFRYLQPALWQELRQTIAEHESRTVARIEGVLSSLARLFEGRNREGVGLKWDLDRFGPVEFFATRRWPCQLYRMSQHTGVKVPQAENLFTVQVVTADEVACYVALGILHGGMKPVPGRFRDYVALPRPNGYRALHTVVLDDAGARVEVQVLSQHMDRIARFGVAAGASAGSLTERTRLWLGSLVDWQEDVRDPHEFIEAVKADLFADEVYVFTPNGDIHTFPKGATPIDFAFAIHTDVGLHCSGARVNGHPVALRYRLHQGDTVEIITDPSAQPRPEWLGMCATARARTRIKHFLRQQERTRCRNLGRALLEQELSAAGHSLEETAPELLLASARALGIGGMKEAVDVYEAVGSGAISAVDLVRGIYPRDDGPDNLFVRVLRRVTGRASGHAGADRRERGAMDRPIAITRARILGRGEEGRAIVLAPCCRPVPGDPVVGLFEGALGVVVHLESCPEALDRIDKRPVPVVWEEGLALDRAVTLEVRTANRVGLLAEMSRAFSRHGVNIRQANCRTSGDEPDADAVNTFSVTVRDAQQLRALILDLKAIPGVADVERVVAPGRTTAPAGAADAGA